MTEKSRYIICPDGELLPLPLDVKQWSCHRCGGLLMDLTTEGKITGYCEPTGDVF